MGFWAVCEIIPKFRPTIALTLNLDFNHVGLGIIFKPTPISITVNILFLDIKIWWDDAPDEELINLLSANWKEKRK
jgi:hypothetical protein